MVYVRSVLYGQCEIFLYVNVLQEARMYMERDCDICSVRDSRDDVLEIVI